jgi:hypothetical protein
MHRGHSSRRAHQPATLTIPRHTRAARVVNYVERPLKLDYRIGGARSWLAEGSSDLPTPRHGDLRAAGGLGLTIGLKCRVSVPSLLLCSDPAAPPYGIASAGAHRDAVIAGAVRVDRCLILVGAMGAENGVPCMANDGAAKAYVHSLGEALHYEFKPLVS